MTARRDLLDDDFAAFIDENARGIGLPASERRYRQRPNPFAVFGAWAKRVTAVFERLGQVVLEIIPDLSRLTAAFAALVPTAWEDGPDAANWRPDDAPPNHHRKDTPSNDRP